MAKNIITSFTIQVLLLIDNLMSVEQLPVQTEAYYKSILIPMSNDQYIVECLIWIATHSQGGQLYQWKIIIS